MLFSPENRIMVSSYAVFSRKLHNGFFHADFFFVMHPSIPFSLENGVDDIFCSFMLFSSGNRIMCIIYAVYWLTFYAVFGKPHNASELQILFRILKRYRSIILTLLF